jgi:hypothetical protein
VVQHGSQENLAERIERRIVALPEESLPVARQVAHRPIEGRLVSAAAGLTLADFDDREGLERRIAAGWEACVPSRQNHWAAGRRAPVNGVEPNRTWPVRTPWGQLQPLSRKLVEFGASRPPRQPTIAPSRRSGFRCRTGRPRARRKPGRSGAGECSRSPLGAPTRPPNQMYGLRSAPGIARP